MVLNAIQYYSNKYGTKAAGWYLDGLQTGYGSYMEQFNTAARSGNSDTLIAFNVWNGFVNGHCEDIAQSEPNILNAVHIAFPNGGTINGEQTAATSYISQWYGRDGQEPNFPCSTQTQTGPRYTDNQIIKGASEYISSGGVLILDVSVS